MDTKNMIMKYFLMLCFSFIIMIHNSIALETQKLHIYSWAGYIKPSVIQKFEKEFNIKTTISFSESNMMTESKMLSGHTGFDIITMSTSPYLARQIDIGLVQKINKSKLPNHKYISKKILKLLSLNDPNNQFSIPITWGTLGIGYDHDRIFKIMPNAPINSLDMIFKKDIVKHFSKCGVYIDDEPAYMIPIALSYLGLDPNSRAKEDLQKISKMLNEIRPYVTNIGSSNNVDALARGDACLMLGFSGDIIQSLIFSKRDAKKPVNIKYSIPKEGTEFGIDVFAIPTDATNVENAHKFLNFIMRPDIAAINSEYNGFPSGNYASYELIDNFLTSLNSFNLEKTLKNKYYILNYHPHKSNNISNQRYYNRTWNLFKTFENYGDVH